MIVEHIVLECLLNWLQEEHKDTMNQIKTLNVSIEWVQEERSRIEERDSFNPEGSCSYTDCKEKSLGDYNWKLCSELFELEQLRTSMESCIDFLFDVKNVN